MLKRILSFLMVAIISFSLASGIFADDYSDEELWKAAKKISAAAKNFDEFYKVEGFTLPADKIGVVMSFVYNENPDLFCLSSGYEYGYEIDNVTGERMVTKIIFKYIMTAEEYALAMAEVEKWIDGVVSLADPGFTDYEYALFFHDYICANYEYDTENDSDNKIRNVYDFIKTGKGVCQAYTYLYELLMERVGVETSWALSYYEMNHMWNVVKIDGEWYHVDLTWDDPVGNAPGDVGHGYFMLSDKAISTEEKGHFGWVSPYGCDSEKYDGSAIADADSAFAYIDGKWYYVKDRDLYSTDSPDKSGKLFMELGLKWYTWPDEEKIYNQCYSAVMARKGMLYVSTSDSVLKIDVAAKTAAVPYKYNGTDGRVYGFRIDMGEDGVSGAGFADAKVLVNVATAPNMAGKLHSAKLVTILYGGSGDANGDGKTNISDVSFMLKYLAHWDVKVNEADADVDGNGKVNISDVSYVLKILARWDIERGIKT